MEMNWTERLYLDYQPLGVRFSDKKPAAAIEPQEGKRACIVPFILAAFKGKAAIFSRRTTLCPGGRVGLCFGDYPSRDWIEHFLSSGKEGAFEGERYKKNPALAAASLGTLPLADIPQEYVIFQPLQEMLAAGDMPEIVLFYANAHQMSALTVLANFGRSDNENVVMPFGAGCQTLVLLPYAEATKEKPRAIAGFTDITVRPMADMDNLTFAVPYKMYCEMRENAAESFLQGALWERVLKRMEER